MKHVISFEKLNNKYKVGDFVLMKISSLSGEFENFINTTPGQIYKITPIYSNRNGDRLYLYDELLVLYENENVSPKIQSIMIKSNAIKGPLFKVFDSPDIKYYAETEDELDAKIKSEKYNL